MKTIKSALLGTKSLIDTNDKVILVQLTGILKEQRELIIDRLLRDIPTYLDYKFNVRTDKSQIAAVKDALINLKNSDVDLNYYKDIIMNVLSNSNTHLTNEPFYVEIDEHLLPCVSTKALMVE
jgi:uncharacterized protein Smg (DUF494 family)